MVRKITILTTRENTVARYRLLFRFRFFSPSPASIPNSLVINAGVLTSRAVSFTSRLPRIASIGAIFDALRAGIQAEIRIVTAEHAAARKIAFPDITIFI